MRFLLTASLLIVFSPNFALAGDGCALDVSQNPAVGGLKDAQLKFNPTSDRKNQVCTSGKQHICIYTKNGKTPCKEETDSSGKAQPEVCGQDLLKDKDQDGLLYGDRSTAPGQQTPQGAQLGFAYTFTPDQSGNLIILIHPKDQQGNVEKNHDLKIEPSAMGDQAVRINTYDGSTAKSQFAVMVSAPLGGVAPQPSCPVDKKTGKAEIALVGRGSAARNPSGNWFSLANGDSKDGLDGNAANDNIRHNATYTAGNVQ